MALLLSAALGLIPITPVPASAPVAVQEDESIHAEGETFRVVSLWRSERSLDRFARDGVAIADAVAAAAGVGATEPKLVLGLAESPRTLRKATKDAPPQTLFSPEVPFEGAAVPAVSAWPALHDRALFRIGLPSATRRQLARAAARELIELTEPDHPRPAGRGLFLTEAGLEAAGSSRGIEAEPWCSTGLHGLQLELEEIETVEARVGRFNELVASAPAWSGEALGVKVVTPFAATSADIARLLLEREPGHDAGAAIEGLAELRPRWRIEAGAIGTHEFGWHVSATNRADALMLSVVPEERANYVIEAEIFLISSDLRTPPQADIVFGDVDGDRFLLACSCKEGLYLFRRRGPGAEYEAIVEAKGVKPPVGQRLEVRIEVTGDRVNCTVGGAPLEPARIGDRGLGGSFGIGAHRGSTVLFSDPVVTGG